MDLFTIFSKKENWDYVFICIFDIEPIEFLETQIINNLNVRKNITFVMDYWKYRELFHDTKSLPTKLGVYYNIENIKIKNGGSFHPKLYLFVSDNKIKIVIGSFNVTDNAFKKNLESGIVITIDQNNIIESDYNLINQVSDLLKEIFLDKNTLIEFVSVTLKTTISDILKTKLFKDAQNKKKYATPLNIIWSLNSSIYSQILSKYTVQIDELNVISPFYDSHLRQSLESLDEIKKLTLIIPKNRSTFPKELMKNYINFSQNVTCKLVSSVESNIERTIHAKLYQITAEKEFLVIGSSNFTEAGFLSNTHPRNLEIAVIIEDDKFFDHFVKSKFEIEDYSYEKINVIEDNKTVHENTYTHSSDFISAYYKSNRIYVELGQELLDWVKYNEISVKLLIDSVKQDESFLLAEEDDLYYFEPNLEIDGNSLIQIELFNVSQGYHSDLLYVKRLHHEPNFLPVLGSSAYNRCVSKGGIEGIQMAFDLAKNSNRVDWMHYILSHWNLEKIFNGLANDRYDDQFVEESYPHLSDSSKTKIPTIYKKNINEIILGNLGDNDFMIKNIKSFINSIDEKIEGLSKRIELFCDYVFPCLYEIVTQYNFYLKKSEAYHVNNPTAEYPEYTWLHNYKTLNRYFSLCIRLVKKTMESHDFELNHYHDKFVFLYLFFRCFDQTDKTLKKYLEKNQKVLSYVKRKFFSYERKMNNDELLEIYVKWEQVGIPKNLLNSKHQYFKLYMEKSKIFSFDHCF